MRRSGKQEDSKALVTIDGEGVDWTSHSEEEEDYALMACNSSGSDTKMSANDKFGLGYGDYRFVTAEGMHAVPPPMTGNYMPYGPDIEIDYSQFTYGTKLSQTSESENQTSDSITCESNCSDKTHESLSEQAANEPKVLVLLREKEKLLLSPQQVVIGDQKDITGTKSPNTKVDHDYPHRALQNKVIVDSGFPRHMTRNKAYLAEYQAFNGGPVAFGGSKGYITGKGKIKTGKLDFEDVCFVKELQHFNLFSMSQMCDKKNKVKRDQEGTQSENQVNKHAGLQESNHNAVKSSKVNNAGEEPTKHPDFKQVDKEDQLILASLHPVSTACPYGGLSFTDLTNIDQDDSEIPALEDIYDNPNDGIFTNASYDDEGIVADFTNLESTMNFKQGAKCTKVLEPMLFQSMKDISVGETDGNCCEGADCSLNLGLERHEFIRICHRMEKVRTINHSRLLMLRFAKLINDMRNIKMTMSKIQLNSKFVNNMLPEWGRFVTAVKLNKGLKDSNFDQLYAYLKQHEAHANENKIMLIFICLNKTDRCYSCLDVNVSPQHYHS
ncbi:hypothetical protein Tco_1310882 [Tanacetum coccineum]